MLFETLKFIDSLTSHMSMGRSVTRSIEMSIQDNQSQISKFADYFLRSVQHGESATKVCLKLIKSENKILFMILEMGIQGYPIQQTLVDFHNEVKISNSLEIETYHRTLPLKLFLPLVLFYFPALSILFLGPFVVDFLSFF